MGEFLRERGNEIERAWSPDNYSGREKGRALHILRGAVIIVRHVYDRDPASGAGNCWCGRSRGSSLHAVISLTTKEGEE